MPGLRTRRRTLQALASTASIGLAGCLGGPIGSVGTTSPTESTVDVSFTAAVEQSFTEDHPGRVAIALANEGDEPFAMGVTHGIEGPLSVIEGHRAGGDATLVLLGDPPEGDHETPPWAPCESGEYAVPEEPTDGCWQPACEVPRLTAHYAIPVAAGERLAWPYVVLDGFNDACLPAGTYVFAETAPIAVSRASGGATPPGGPTHYLNKRVALDLAADGTLTADASVDSEPVDAPAATADTDPPTPQPADG